MNDIVKIINKAVGKKELKNFCIELVSKFAEDFNVSTCAIKVLETDNILNTHPAYYSRSKKTIFFRDDVVSGGDLARLLKLVSHEWMHYITYESIDTNKYDLADKRYADLIKLVKTDKLLAFVRSLEDQPNREYIEAINKLSPLESVADLFAQDVLKDVVAKIEDKDLAYQINQQIISHEKQIAKMKKILVKNERLHNEILKLYQETCMAKKVREK